MRKHPTKKRIRSLRSDLRSERSKSYSLSLVTDATSLHPVRSRFYCSVVPKKKAKLPLSKTHPKLAKELVGANATEISRWSKEKYSWKCSKGHCWEASPESRTHLNSGCPYCAGSKAIPGENDLRTIFPEVAAQADGWDPSKESAFSGKKQKWKCELGHIWESTISNRTKRGDGCTVCSGRKLMVGVNDFQTRYPELAKELIDKDPSSFVVGKQKLKWKCKFGHTWTALVGNRVFHLQGCPVCTNKKILLGFNDFKTTHPELAKELVEGDPSTFTHGTNKSFRWKCKLGHIYSASPGHRTSEKKTGCPICSGKQILIGFNDFLSTNPEEAARLINADPKTFTKGSNKYFTWSCNLGHTWKATTNTVIRSSNSACPYCAGQKVLIGFNDLNTTHPTYAQNAYGWDPKKYTAGSNKKVKWRCSENHKWEASIASVTRSKYFGCPSCNKGGFDPNEKAYLYFIQHNYWKMLQIGITNFPDNRLKDHKSLGWELIEIRGPMDGHLTQQWETAILRMLKAKGADLSNSKIAGRFDGYSEAWSKSTFPVKSIKELMQFTEKFEEGK